jgi:RNA polymerase sigma-70 factor (ECF subfamily)
MRDSDDALLIALAQRGSLDAVAELFERYWPVAWQAAFAVTGNLARADDAAQDAIQRAFAALDRFETGRPFAPWIRKIAANRAIDELRRDSRLVEIDDIAGAGEDNRIYFGVLLELFLIIANLGTALVLIPLLKRQNEILTFSYVAARVMECSSSAPASSSASGTG